MEDIKIKKLKGRILAQVFPIAKDYVKADLNKLIRISENIGKEKLNKIQQR